jgi:hypothetical protein
MKLVFVAGVSLALLSGCSAPAPTTVPAADMAPHEEGSGPGQAVFNRFPDSAYLMSHFDCGGDGQFMVVLKEDIRVYMGGQCSGSKPLNPGGSSYQMPLPEMESTLTFDVTVDAGSDWEFGGEFMPAQGSSRGD